MSQKYEREQPLKFMKVNNLKEIDVKGIKSFQKPL
jgi:hypothetical protein